MKFVHLIYYVLNQKDIRFALENFHDDWWAKCQIDDSFFASFDYKVISSMYLWEEEGGGLSIMILVDKPIDFF